MKNTLRFILGSVNSYISKTSIFLLFALSIVCNASSAETIQQVSAGWEHTVALKSDGTVWTWGANKVGQLGDGTTMSKALPIQVGGLLEVVTIDGGEGHTLAVKLDGTVWAWGLNNYGQLGDGTTENKNVPVQVTGLFDIIAVACGSHHSAALDRNGDVWTWGANDYGQLGIGGESSLGSKRNKPEKVTGLNGIIALACGGIHTIALRKDGEVYVWGCNKKGQIGDGTYINRTAPVRVDGLSGIIAITSGGALGGDTNSHSLALKSDGTVWTWGSNSDGQLGDGTDITRNTPVQVGGLSHVIAIAGGGAHSAALKSDGTVWTWGCNWAGQLGIGIPFSIKNKPVQVKYLSKIVTLASGWMHSIAAKSDGTLYAWGYNGLGELGDGTFTNRSLPVSVKLPLLETDATRDITSNSATLIGKVKAHRLPMKVWFEYGLTNQSYTHTSSKQYLKDSTDETIRIDISGLSEGAVYYCRIAAQHGEMGTFYGNEISFATNDTTPPTGSVGINDGNVYTNSTTVTLHLASKDSMGVSGYYLSTDSGKPPANNSTWKSITAVNDYAGDVIWNVANVGLSDGVNVITVAARDGAGNEGADTIEITGKRDMLAPAMTEAPHTNSESFDTDVKRVSVTDKNISDGTVKINNNADYTNSCSVTLNLSASDDAGIAGYLISIDSTKPLSTDSGWKSVPSTTSYSENVPFTLGNGDGTKTVYVWYKDTSENISEVASDSIYLDTTAPVVNITTPVSGKEYLSTSSTISLGGGAEDNESGVKSVTWSDDLGRRGITDGITSWTISKIGLPRGSITITVNAIDSAGNIGSAKIIIANGMAPTVMTVSASNITSDSVTLNGKVNAYGLSTTALFEYGTESGQYDNTTPPQNLDGTTDSVISAGIMALLQGKTYYYRVAARNNAGTTYGDEMSFDTLDTTAPVGSIKIKGGDTYTNSTTVTINLAASDNVGVTGYYISMSKEASLAIAERWTSVPSAANYNANISYALSSGDGTKTAYVWFRDDSWDISEAVSDDVVLDTTSPLVTITKPCLESTYTVENKSRKVPEVAHLKDTDPPDGSITINNDEKYTDSRNVTVNLSATDNVGIVGYYISMDPATPSSFNPGWKYITSTPRLKDDVSYILSGNNGAKIICAWYKDLSGNVSKAASDDIILNIKSGSIILDTKTIKK